MKQRSSQQRGLAQPENQLYEAILSIKTVAEAKMFFEDLCTPTELQAMADRWSVVEPVKAGIPYRSIHEQTGVSVTTIGRIARCLSLGSGGYELVYQRLKKLSETDKV